MPDFEIIKNEYDTSLHKFPRGLMREYLQYQILAIIFSHKISTKLSFLGGTALRMVYNLDRFSEDLDFDNKELTLDEFQMLSEFVKKELEKLGFTVEIRIVAKKAFHCHIKFPDLLFQYGLSPLKSEKVTIQLDTFNQGVDYDSEIFILDKFDVFKQIRVTPKSVILAQKLWTITQRKRAKGRDFYDIMFLLQHTQPDPTFLEAKFGSSDTAKVAQAILKHTEKINLAKMAKDVEPFLTNPQDAERILLFNDFLKQKLVIPK